MEDEIHGLIGFAESKVNQLYFLPLLIHLTIINKWNTFYSFSMDVTLINKVIYGNNFYDIYFIELIQ
jgi:hypothetical protein